MDDRSSERLRNLLHDVEAIKRACSQDVNCPFKEFEYSDYLFRFEYHFKNEKRYYWVNLSEDYPNGSMLTGTINGREEPTMKQFDLPLPFVFNSVAKELYREIAIPILCPSRSALALAASSGRTETEDNEYDDDDSNYDEEEEFNEDNEYGDDRNVCLIDNLDIVVQGHEELREDFEILRCYCAEAQMHEIPSLDEVVIEIPLSTTFLEDELARAWRLIPQMPIFIRVFFSLTKYCEDASSTRVEAYQEKHGKNGAGVLIQLQGILTTFVKSIVEECCRQSSQSDSKFKKSKKTAPKQPLCPPKPKLPRLSASTTNQPDPKSPPNLGQGLLAEIFNYAQQRLLTLNDYCVICDELHTFMNAAMLKPMVCDRALCVFSYQTLGVMSSVTDDIAVETEVVDLLIAMAKAACGSSRCAMIFDPYPTVVNPLKAQEFVFTAENKNTIDLVRQVMTKFIPMEEMTRMLGVELKVQLDATDRLIYPLLQWIISSNRSHIVSLKTHQRLSFMKTTHQFLLRSSPPAKEAAFYKAKAIHGSVFAFHGSSIENWHSILRKGLLNASGTALQLNGAAYGKGIYLSPEASLSFSYSSFHRSFPSVVKPPSKITTLTGAPYSGSSLHLLPPQGMTCIALCEVVASKSLKRMNSSIWVMPEEDYVVTRFLFVFEDSEQKRVAVRSDDPRVLAEIRRALP